MDEGDSQKGLLFHKFSLPGQTPDTQFVLFGKTEIQLHSIILKLHSAFFRKFLDSPDKTPADPSAEFRYEWVSEVEQDGTWYMTEKSHAISNNNKLSEDKIQDIEILTFIEMLNGLYRIPYKVFVSRLILVTEMADYYCCLPAVSHNLYGCFSMTDNWFVANFSATLLDVAYKLRQPLLFKDCVIHIAGEMLPGSSQFHHPYNKKIHDVIMKAQNEIFREIVDCQRKMVVAPPKQGRSKLLSHCWELGFSDMDGDLSLPRYYRLLANEDGVFATIFKKLLGNELQMPSGLQNEAGGEYGSHTNQFYCARLSDKDLPWDTTQTDW